MLPGRRVTTLSNNVPSTSAGTHNIWMGSAWRWGRRSASWRKLVWTGPGVAVDSWNGTWTGWRGCSTNCPSFLKRTIPFSFFRWLIDFVIGFWRLLLKASVLQGFQALTDLLAFKGSEQRPNSLEEFVSACKEKLKHTCTREKDLLFHQPGQKECKCDGFWSSRRRPVSKDVFLCCSFKDSWETAPESLKKRDLCLVQGWVTWLSRTKAPPGDDWTSVFPTDADLELDLNTAPVCLSISKTKKSVFWGDGNQVDADHPDRFTYFYQVLCHRGLRETSYWEVSWDGGVVEVAVSYIGIQRKGSGSQCCFGHNKLSWKLICSPSGCTFWHNKLHRSGIPAAACNRVGVHLEYMEGRLSFYSILDPKTMVLLHQTQTIFTEPLYPGFSVDLGAKLKICNLKAPSKSWRTRGWAQHHLWLTNFVLFDKQERK